MDDDDDDPTSHARSSHLRSCANDEAGAHGVNGTHNTLCAVATEPPLCVQVAVEVVARTRELPNTFVDQSKAAIFHTSHNNNVIASKISSIGSKVGDRILAVSEPKPNGSRGAPSSKGTSFEDFDASSENGTRKFFFYRINLKYNLFFCEKLFLRNFFACAQSPYSATRTH